MSNHSITLHQIRFKNFFSYGKTWNTVKLDQPGLTLIKGTNKDDINNISNGAGKSTIVNAVLYALYGDVLVSSKKADSVVNARNKKGCVCELTLSIQNNKYVITRYRKGTGDIKNGVTVIQVDQQGNQIKDLTRGTVSETNKLIENIVGIPKQLFERLIIFDADIPHFFNLSAQQQRDFLESLFNLDILSKTANRLKSEEKKALEQQIALFEELEQKYKQQLKDYKTSLKQLKQQKKQWDEQQQARIEKLEERIQQLSSRDIEQDKKQLEKNQQVQSSIDELRDINEQLEKLMHETINKKIERISNKIDEVESKYKFATNQFDSIKNELERKKTKLEAFLQSVCPECGQKYHDKERIEQLKQQIVNLLQEANQAKETKKFFKRYIRRVRKLYQYWVDVNTDAVKKYRQNTAKIKELTEYLNEHDVGSLKELNMISDMIERTKEEIEYIKEQENPYIFSIENLKKTKPEAPDYEQYEQIKKQYDHVVLLIKLFTDKNSPIRKKLIQTRLMLINTKLDQYLKGMLFPYKVTLKPDLTFDITHRGNPISMLSHGQRAKVNFALSLAFRDVMANSLCNVNLLLLDEVLDKALCASSIAATIKMISQKAREEGLDILLITHKHDNVAPYSDNCINVIYENGFSRIENG
jgi:DNA repair exonuclease SbcCD ATPase subunit